MSKFTKIQILVGLGKRFLYELTITNE